MIGFIPFPRVLVLCEMQSVSSRIWTCVTMSISCDNNHYTTSTSNWFQFSLNISFVGGGLRRHLFLIYFFSPNILHFIIIPITVQNDQYISMDWWILMACQPVWGYSMPWGCGTESMVYLYLHFLCSCFLRIFCTQLYSFKYSYLILLIIWLQIIISINW